MKVTLIVTTLNEIDGMRQIMPMIKKEWVDQIIIMDGGSTDGTIEYARKQGYFVYVQKKIGFRNGYTEVIPYIKGDFIITFSPDGNCIPGFIPALIEKAKEGYDMVIASRYLKEARSQDDDPVTAFGNWIFTFTVNMLYRGSYTDVMGIYRIYRVGLIHELELDKDAAYSRAEKLFNTHISWEPLLSVRAAKRRLKIAEIPADEPARIGGKRKLKILKWGAAYYFQFLREFFLWR